MFVEFVGWVRLAGDRRSIIAIHHGHPYINLSTQLEGMTGGVLPWRGSGASATFDLYLEASTLTG